MLRQQRARQISASMALQESHDASNPDVLADGMAVSTASCVI
jgi:hypothetical protein